LFIVLIFEFLEILVDNVEVIEFGLNGGESGGEKVVDLGEKGGVGGVDLGLKVGLEVG
jgi:hypothetical protein